MTISSQVVRRKTGWILRMLKIFLMMKMNPEVVSNREEDSELDSDDNGLDASKDSGKSKKHCHST